MSHKTYRIGDAITVTQQLDDGTWMATFPGFVTFGTAEGGALVNLAAKVEDTAKRIRAQATEVSAPSAEPTPVTLRTYTAPNGDVRGQVVHAETDEILHEAMWTILRQDALRDAMDIATRHEYRVVEVRP